MALNLGNWIRDPIKFDTGLGELAQNFREGQKMREGREQYQQEREGRGYGNMIKAAEAMYAPQQQQANLQLTQGQGRYLAEQIKGYPQKLQAEIYSLLQQGKEREAQAAIHAIDAGIKQYGYDYIKLLMQDDSGYAPKPAGMSDYSGIGSQVMQNSPDEIGLAPSAGVETTNQNFSPMGQAEVPKFDRNGQGPSRVAPYGGQYEAAAPESREKKLEKALNTPVGRALLKTVGIEPLQEDIKRRESMDALDIKHLETTQNALLSEQAVLDNLYALKDLTLEFPQEFNNISGPISSVWKQYKGTDAEKQILGSIKTLSGNITTAVAGSLPGAFRAGEQTLIENIKPTEKDTPEVFRGKMNTLIRGMELVQKRNELISEYISSGMKADKAIKLAREKTSLEPIKTLIMSYKNAQNNTSEKSSESNYSMEDIDAEIARRMAGGQ